MRLYTRELQFTILCHILPDWISTVVPLPQPLKSVQVVIHLHNQCTICIAKVLGYCSKIPSPHPPSFLPLTPMFETDACTKCVVLETGTHCNCVTLGEHSCKNCILTPWERYRALVASYKHFGEIKLLNVWNNVLDTVWNRWSILFNS